jgi:hypothetical protein
MKTQLFLSLLLLAAAVAPSALAAGDHSETNARTRNGQPLATLVEQSAPTDVPPGPAVEPADPDQESKGYDSILLGITQKFSSNLAAIAEAVTQGDLTSEQAKELSIQQYQLAHMQFELISLWRGLEEHAVTRIPDVEAEPDSMQESEVVMVALPFSSLQLNPSLVRYLSLTSFQVQAIQQVMMREQHSIEPLMTELRTTRETLLAIGSERINEKELKALADTEASGLAKLIVANARMQSKIYKLLSPDQRKKLSNLERTQSAVMTESK